MRILALVQHLTTFGVQCVIDLLCQVEINNTGGLANWLPYAITNADKILVVVTPNYLQVYVTMFVTNFNIHRELPLVIFAINPLTARIFTLFGHSLLDYRTECYTKKHGYPSIQVHKKVKFS